MVEGGPPAVATTLSSVRVLLIDAYRVDDPDRAAAEVAAGALVAAGHDVDHHRLVVDGFEPFMTADERAAYHEDEPLVTDETRAAAHAVAAAEALVFCYPTTTFTVPAVLKGWLERVLVPGVAFVFDAKGRVAPGMTNIRRLGVVTTTPHGWVTTRRARDQGRRTIMWTLRLNCHRWCRRTFVSTPTGRIDERRIRRALGRW
jgi:putative NADPH-quinone reductase